MKCALCGKDFDGTKKGFVEHASLEKHIIDPEYEFAGLIATLTEYIFELQKRIEDLESKSK
jgi:hypothetical protein